MPARMLRLARGSVTLLALSALSWGQQQPKDRPRLADYEKDIVAPYVNSPEPVVLKMLQMAHLKPGETLYDLGCGDGRIIIMAAEQFRVKAIGVELAPREVKKANEEVKKHHLQASVRVIQGNMLQQDLSPADVITLYLTTTANESLRPNLERYLRNNARVVSYDYPIPGWRPVSSVDTEANPRGTTHTIYLYQVPNSFK
jgi:SAM-dependent methyltransferase